MQALAVERFNHPRARRKRGDILPGVDGRSASAVEKYLRESVAAQDLPSRICRCGDRAGQSLRHPIRKAVGDLPRRVDRDFAFSGSRLRCVRTKDRNGGAAYARNTIARSLRRKVVALAVSSCGGRGGLRDWYDRQLLCPEQIAERLADGTLVIDDSVLRTLEASRGK